MAVRKAHSGAVEVADLAAVLIERLPELAAQLTERICAIPDRDWSWRSLPVSYLRAACKNHLKAMLHALAAPNPDLSTMREAGRRAAELGTPLAAILHVYRAGARFTWDALVTEAARNGRTRSTALVTSASSIWALADEGAEIMTIAYRDAMSHRLRQDEQSRSAVIEALLEGRITDTEAMWRAADVLRLPYDGQFVVVAAEVGQLGHEALGNVQSRLDAQGIGSAWRLAPEMQIGVVSLRKESLLEKLITILRRIASSRVGVSPLYRLLSQTPQGLRFARLAMAGTEPTKPSVTLFNDQPLTAIVVSSPDTTVRAARVVLGTLLQLPRSEYEGLLTTLAAWFAAQGSATAAGERLHCHPNTVRYRLRRIQDATGRSMTDPRAVAELYVALEAVRRLPESTWHSTQYE